MSAFAPVPARTGSIPRRVSETLEHRDGAAEEHRGSREAPVHADAGTERGERGQDEAGGKERVPEAERLDEVAKHERHEEPEPAVRDDGETRGRDAGSGAQEIVRRRRCGRQEDGVRGGLHRRDEHHEEKRGESRARDEEHGTREELGGRTADGVRDPREGDRRRREAERELGEGGAESRPSRATRVACGQELGPHVASDGVREADEDEERKRVSPRETRARREVEELRRRPGRREGAEGERKGNAEEARHHEGELEEVRPDDGALTSERRVRDEKGRRDDEDARGLPRRRRDDDGLGRFGQEGEPDDLREDDEKGGDPAHALAVRPADDLGDRRRARCTQARREKEAEGEEAERPREIEPERGQAHPGDERGEDERRGPADHRGGEGRPGHERAEAAVRDEERVRRARGRACRKEADEEDGGAVEDEGENHASALLRPQSARTSRAKPA